MIMFIIEDVTNSEDIYYQSTVVYIEQILSRFQIDIIGIFAVLTIYSLIAILFVIKRRVVNPISELTDIVQNGGKSQKNIDKFISKI